MRCVVLLEVLAITIGMVRPSCAAEVLPMPKGPILLTLAWNVEQTNPPRQAGFDKEVPESLSRSLSETGSAFSDGPQRYEGGLLRDVAEWGEAKGHALRAAALDRYAIPIPGDDLKSDMSLAMKIDGAPMRALESGLLWIVYPRDQDETLKKSVYASRCSWQLNKFHIE